MTSTTPEADGVRPDEHYDVIIVGAGLSGVCAAVHLAQRCPDKRVLVLERRATLGGTWDLFRYPGVRSDSDMFALGYGFSPWRGPTGIAEGEEILRYIRETAEARGVSERVRYGCGVEAASWCSERARWTLTVRRTGTDERFAVSCHFLIGCTGYYRYDEGYTPDFEGMSSFEGQIVHPQQWPDDLPLADRRVVVVGSGATAITLVPGLAARGARVTMLQRSPTYVVAAPRVDRLSAGTRMLPEGLSHALVRWKNIGYGVATFWIARRFPALAKRVLVAQMRRALGPDIDVERHFTPRYDPWDQRVCLTPDGVFFQAVRSGQVQVVTDQIERFVPEGIRLVSGKVLGADLVITATGLRLQTLGGMQITVDGTVRVPADLLAYKGVMYQDVPNAAILVGYTNASWTLKADLCAEYICRVLQHMEAGGYRSCCPRQRASQGPTEPVFDFTSGYVQRGLHELPKQGTRAPWRVHQNYLRDLMALRYSAIDDGILDFRGAPTE